LLTQRQKNSTSFEDYLAFSRSVQEVKPNAQKLNQAITESIYCNGLTEDFYQSVIEISRLFVKSKDIVLDVGCGLGRISIEATKLGADYVIGLDLSPAMITEAIKVASAKNDISINLNSLRGGVAATLHPDWDDKILDFIVGNSTNLPVLENAIDVAFALNLIDRVPYPMKVVREIGRVLKSGGYLIIIDPYDWRENYTARENQVADMADLFNKKNWKLKYEVDGIPFFIRGSEIRKITTYLNHCMVYQKEP